jgi:hypothetical protein
MKRTLGLMVGLAVTALTTLAWPGGLTESAAVGTFSGVLAVGIVSLLLHRQSGR